MQQQRQQNKAIIIRVRSENIDHYSVFDGVKGNKLKLFDSDHLPYIKVNDISHIKDDAKFQLLIRQLYVFGAVQSDYTEITHQEICANYIETTIKCTSVKPSHKFKLHI